MMNINIHAPKGLSSNKGSSNVVITYLTKEEVNQEGELSKKEGFFNSVNDFIKAEEAQKIIDEQAKGLKKKDSKFFMLTINPSQKEIEHILKGITMKKITSISELSDEELQKYHKQLKEYTTGVMNIYAEQFDREINGKKITGEDLVYVAKIEESREYKSTDEQVKDNEKLFIKILTEKNTKKKKELEKQLHKTNSGVVIQAGLKKEGFHSHIHIVVSRQDKNKSTQLSPLANSRGYSEKHKLNGKEVKVGFSRIEFYLKGEALFDSTFSYQRQQYEKKEEHISKAREKQSDATKIIDKYGHLDPINSFHFFKNNLSNIAQGKNISVVNVKEKIKQEINPIAKFKNEINPVQKAKSNILKALKSGGMEM